MLSLQDVEKAAREKLDQARAARSRPLESVAATGVSRCLGEGLLRSLRGDLQFARRKR